MFKNGNKNFAPRFSTAGTVVAAAKQAIKMYKAASAYKNRKNAAQPKRKRATKSLVKREFIAKGEGVETRFDLTNKPSPAVKIMKKTNAPNHVINNFSGSLAWAVGRQNATQFMYFDNNQMTNVIAQLPASTSVGNLNRRFLIDKFQSEVTFSNGTNASCYVHVYDIMYKNEMDATDTTINTPAVAWNTGEAQQGGAGIGIIGTDPRKIDTFKTNYKILKLSKHFMKPGDIHKHHCNVNYNRLINETRIVNSTYYGGFSLACMIVAHGTPATNDAVPPVVSTTAGQIALTFSNKYIYRYSLDNQQNTQIIQSFQQPTGLEVVQEDGDIDAVTDA